MHGGLSGPEWLAALGAALYALLSALALTGYMICTERRARRDRDKLLGARRDRDTD